MTNVSMPLINQEFVTLLLSAKLLEELDQLSVLKDMVLAARVSCLFESAKITYLFAECQSVDRVMK